jgi:hypothetical protein
VGPRSLNVRPTYRHRRLWPWVVGVAVLLAAGLGELGAHRPRGTKASRETEAPADSTAAAPGTTSPAAAGTSGAAASSGTGAPGPSVPRVHGLGGRVFSSDGRPAPAVEVTVLPAGPDARSDAQGRFAVPLENGTTVLVEAHHSDLGFASAEVTVPASGVELRLEPRATVVVKVLSGGRPVSGATVSVEELQRHTGTFHADRSTDSAGTLRFLGLPGGRLLVEARVEGTGARGVASVEANEGSVTEVTLTLAPVATRAP